jgi:transposase
MPKTAAPLPVRGADLVTLRNWVRARSTPAGLAQRSRILLLAAEGAPNSEIARQVGVSRPTVLLWRRRYVEAGLDGLADRPKPGRPATVDVPGIVAATLMPPPARLGVTHWSSRLLAAELGLHPVTVSRTWKLFGLQPWRTERFKFSTDPKLEAKVRDIVGLYLNPPEQAVVLCLDEKSQVQALDRTAPILPLRPGVPERQTHDYVRHGVTTLFAALEVATGKVVDTCLPRHRHIEFLAFLKQLARVYPRRELHLVLDNYGTHKHPAVKAWLARHPRIHLHFTPTGCSWLNLVEVFFSIITRQAIRRGTFGSVKALVAAIRRFIDGWNERCQPFVWTTDADTVVAKAMRKATLAAQH